MSLEFAQKTFTNILYSLGDEDKRVFQFWLREKLCEGPGPSEKALTLRLIAEDIKTMVPLDATFPSEKIFDLEESPDAAPSIHVDSFLFDDDDVDVLVDEGKISRNYCKNCRSLDIAPTTFVSHSVSIERIMFMFDHMLPDLKNKCFLDIGSRLGAILYGAYYCSSANRIVGVEMNKDLCRLQNEIIENYNMKDRIKVICDNICNIPEDVQAADVIVLNNVFECFLTKKEQEKTWVWLRQNITKSGAIIITMPSLEDTLKNLETGIDIPSWLKRRSVKDVIAGQRIECGNLISEICSYVVI